jgi:hypothetical protein
MSVIDDYRRLVAKEKDRHKREISRINLWLFEKQEECPEHKWERDEQLFYALGETYPGEQCTECGKKRRV